MYTYHDGLYSTIEQQLPNYKYWLVIAPNFKIGVEERPSFIFRFWTKILLGWSYEEVKEYN